MPGTTSRPRPVLRAAGLAAALALAACTEREIDVTPFRIQASLDGAALPQGVTEYAGVGAVDGERAIRVTSAQGQVLSVSFDEAGEPDVRFPADLQGRDTIVRVQVDEAHVSPSGEPLTIPSLQVITRNNAGFFEFRLILGESTYTAQSGLGALPILFLPLTPQDFPLLRIVAGSLYFEPADCGLVYYDQLRVEADDREDLDHHTTEHVSFAMTDWNVRHVVSWHRQGDCPDDAPTWTQAAMWR